MFTKYNVRGCVGDDVEVCERDLFIYFCSSPTFFSFSFVYIIKIKHTATQRYFISLSNTFSSLSLSLSLDRRIRATDYRHSNICFANLIMIFNSIAQHRARHIDLLLVRQLASIEREHAQNLIAHQKLENSIRRVGYPSANNHLRKHPPPFHHIEQQPTGSIESHQLRYSSPKRRLSVGTGSSSASSRTYLDECSDDFSTSTSSQRRRYCTKSRRLPPIAKTNNQRKREHPNQHWMANFQQIDLSKEYLPESWPTFDDELSKPVQEELPPLQRQIRAFLARLPSNKEMQHGFPATALYFNRAPVAIQ